MICMVNRQNLFLNFFVMALFFAMPAHAIQAADPAPGDACTAAGYTSPVWSSTGVGGVGYFLVCNGSTWQRAIQFESSGGIGGGLVIGESSDTCDATTEGGIRYNTTGNYLEFCNGSAWTPIASTTACDGTPSSFEFTDNTNAAQSTLITSNILLIAGTDAACNVIVSVSGGASPNFRICADSSCSSVLQTWTATNTAYDMNGRYLQLRDTSSASANTTINVVASVGGISNTWSISTTSAGSCGASPAIGDTCSDGSVYAGQSPDGNVDMYVARCDIGMSFGGSECTGTRTLEPWNNGNSSGWVTTGYTSNVDGDINTAGLAVQDSDSVTSETQPHQVAQACADLNVHGHTDWYLPANSELSVIYNNLQDGIPVDNNPDPLIDGFITSNYWSSSEADNDDADYRDFYDNVTSYGYGKKNASRAVRCARRD